MRQSLTFPAQPRLWIPPSPPQIAKARREEREREAQERLLWNRLRRRFPWASARKLAQLLPLFSLPLLGAGNAGQIVAGGGGGGAGTLAVDLIAFWELEEASGTRNDAHTNLLHLTDNATVTSNTGKVGTAAEFATANSEYLSHANDALLQTGNVAYTFAFWFYANSHAANRGMISRYPSTAGDREYYIEFRSSQLVNFRVLGTDNATYQRAYSITQADSTWHFVVAFYDPAGPSVNVDVDQATTQTTSMPVSHRAATSTDFWIGRHDTGFFDGRIDQVGFWKRLLTTNEKSYLHNSGSGRDYASVSTASP